MHLKSAKIILLISLFLSSIATAYGNIDSFNKADSSFKEIKNCSPSGKQEIILPAFKLDSLIFTDSLKLHESLIKGNSFPKAELLFKIGKNLYLLGENQKSLEIFKQALSVYKNLSDKSGMAKTLNLIGVINQNFGDYEKALISHLAALNNYEELKNYRGVVLTYNYLGVFYKNLDEFSKSGDYYNNALDILKNNPDSALLARTYNYIADLDIAKGDLKNALIYSLQSLSIKKEIHADRAEMVNSYLNIGTVLRNLKQYRASAAQYNLGVNIAVTTGNKNQLALLLNNLGALYGLTGQYQKAILYYGKSIKLAREINFNRIILDDLYGLSVSYKKTGNFNPAFQYYKKYRHLKDSFFNRNLKFKLSKYRNQYESEKKAKEIQLLRSSRQSTVFFLVRRHYSYFNYYNRNTKPLPHKN